MNAVRVSGATWRGFPPHRRALPINARWDIVTDPGHTGPEMLRQLPIVKLVEEERARLRGQGVLLAGKGSMTGSRPQLTALFAWGGH